MRYQRYSGGLVQDYDDRGWQLIFLAQNLAQSARTWLKPSANFAGENRRSANECGLNGMFHSAVIALNGMVRMPGWLKPSA